ncbi:MAG: UDP-N-acetylmuramoyl-tripeptide--D-alanyl-D-alanine ligase [Clostridia bacterium]|nr:UDP-N-acetylmuramoyl-tripeptide--D-alanyl-D-alanine ligase [Clostridia bacterium]
MMTLTLSEIAIAVGGELFGNGEKTICGISTDSRKTMPEEIFIALRGEKFDGHDFISDLWGRCSAVITEEPAPGFDGVLVPDTLKALGALSAYWKKKVSPKITVGITGSVGKTTTKDLIASVLKEKYKTHCTAGNLNNHIGVPVTLIRIEKDTEAVVCEMGMSGRGEIEYLTGLVRPNLAVITNIGTSHMELLGSREGILEAKLEILSGMEKGSTIILDGDEPLLRSEQVQKQLADFKVIYVGFDSGNDVYPLDIYKGSDHLAFDIIAKGREFRVKVPALGDHFIKNTLFAAAVGIACGVQDEAIQNGVLAYSPSGLRQKIYTKNKIRIIADCYNASPESMEAALKVLKGSEGRKIAVLGDMLELGCLAQSAHEKVGEFAHACGVDKLYTYGKVSYHIMQGAIKAGFPKENAYNSIDADQLASLLKEELVEGDTVLFKASRRMKLEEIIALSDLSEQEE